MKTVIINGVSGFLGSYAARYFLDQGWRVLGVTTGESESPRGTPEFRKMRLPDPGYSEWLRDILPDVCIHCAGSASVPFSLTNPAADYEANVNLTFRVLESLHQNAPRCRFVLLSSAAVYGEPEVLPVKETQALNPLSPYGNHKRQAELICEEFAALHGTSTVCARIFSAYGPGLRRQVIWDICEQYLKKGSLSLKGTGEESRDFIHARDVAQGLFILAERAAANGEVYNLATGVETPISKVANLLADELGQVNRPFFDGTVRMGDPLHWRADISAISELGFIPRVGLEVGLGESVDWIQRELKKIVLE